MSNTPEYRHGSPVPDQDSDSDATERTGMAYSLRERMPVVGGLVAGAGAFLVTYILGALVTFTGRKGSNPWGSVESPPHVLTEASWAVLMNLGVGLQQGGEQLEYDVIRWGSFRFASWPIYSVLIFAIAVGAGYVVADCVRTESPTERIAASLLVVPAYLAFVTVLAVFSTWEPPAETRQVPEGHEVSVALVDAIVYAGVLVPAMLALLGGLLAVGHRMWAANRDPR